MFVTAEDSFWVPLMVQSPNCPWWCGPKRAMTRGKYVFFDFKDDGFTVVVKIITAANYGVHWKSISLANIISLKGSKTQTNPLPSTEIYIN